MQEFDCPGPVTVDLRTGAGTVDITSEQRTSVAVDVSPYDTSSGAVEAARAARVEMSGNRLIIAAPDSPVAWLWRRCPRARITVRVPLDSSLILKVASADLRCRGRYAAAQANLASADLAMEHVTGSLSVNTASGTVEASRVDGDLEIRTASGRVRVGSVGGTAGIHSASGDIEVNHAMGTVRGNTASGDISVHHAQRGQFRLKSASGDINIGVVSGTSVWLDLDSVSGTALSDLPMINEPAGTSGAALSLQVRTMSGHIRIHRVESGPFGKLATADKIPVEKIPTDKIPTGKPDPRQPGADQPGPGPRQT